MARIHVDFARIIGDVDPRTYSGFIEHLGRCIYGGIFDEGSPLSDERGFRADVMEQMRALRPPILRWPGGNFVSGYHWLDGVGPVDERPRRTELAWGAEESNRFGTDEFIAYCREIDTEPYICVNMGSGTMDEAQAWVEYCNGTGNTHWANLRRKHGHEEPFRVKYWGLGNELWGSWQIGALSAEDYVRRAREFAKVMKLTDPSIELIACGHNGWSDWDRVVLQGLADVIDYHAVHVYTGSHDYYTNVFQAHQADRSLRIAASLIEQARYEQAIEHPIKIAYDEWNVWFRTRSLEARRGGIEEQYTLADALAVATYLNIFVRRCEVIGMANVAQMVNAIAPIFTSPDGLFLQTIFHPLKLYSDHMQGTALDIHVQAPEFDLTPEREQTDWPHRVSDLGPFTMLDAAATLRADDGVLMLGVVNRDRDSDQETTIDLGEERSIASITAWEVNGAHPDIRNSFAEPDNVVAVERTVSGPMSSRTIEYTFPKHSITLLRVQLADRGTND
jgi:alpha-L-arabinofuranosidase